MRLAVQLTLLALVAGVVIAEETPVKWTSLHVKWAALGILSYEMGAAYFELPITREAAEKKGWVQAASDDVTTTWCMQDDPRVCVLLDQQGSIAGMQVGIPAEDVEFKGNPYPVSQHPLFNKMTLFDTVVYAGRYFLVDQETLKKGGRASPSELGTGLWLQSGSDLISVPRNASELPAAGWTNENCIPEMGRHYYYNMTPELPCKDMEPYFLVVDNHKNFVHGVGFQTFGKPSKKKRNWFETVPALAVKPTVPTAPDCLVDWASDYGIISLHMYFVDRPWFIMC